VELLLRIAGFARWRILGDYDGRPLERETDAMIVQAWKERQVRHGSKKTARSGRNTRKKTR
jgi:hypothetical protein